MIFRSISELVGKTPIMELAAINSRLEADNKIYAKLEFFNPGGSIKDRVALEMIEQYEKNGLLNKDSTIVEPTSGNTGIGLAAICASRGYKAIIVMPDSMSRERQLLMSAYGAELVLTDGALGMAGAIKRAEEIVKNTQGAILAGQFTNMANPEAHYKTTGPEIFEDMSGDVDIFVATIGTGGTISGTARYLKEKNENIKVVGVEPASSPYLSKGVAGAHKIQGIGAGFKPDTLDLSLVDEIVTVSDDEAIEATRYIARAEGILVGISSGAALSAALSIANRPANKGKRIVTIFPDTGERYLSSNVFM